MSPSVSLRRDGFVATVTIANPRKLNALTLAMWRELKSAMERVSADDAIRCVIVRGEGEKAFAAGADIAEFAEVRDDAEQARVYHGEYVQGALKSVAECRHPTVAMIHGP